VQEETNNSSKKQHKKSILEDVDYYKQKEAKERTGYPTWVIPLAFLAGALFLILAQKILAYISHKKGRKKRAHYSTKEALKILYPHTNQHKKVEVMVRKLYEKEKGNKNISIDAKELDRMVNEVLEIKA